MTMLVDRSLETLRERSVFFGVAICGLLLAGCGAGGRSPEGGRPNLVLVTVDTLRPDHLSCYGYSRKTSPSVDRLAKDSIRFDEATTPRTSTAPSVASAFTGLYPYRHGVLTNFVKMHDDLPTLTQILKDHDYETGAFISNYVLISDFSNLDRGFDVFDDFLTEREPNRAVYERKAESTVQAALAWLEEKKDTTFFLWLHLMDPHGPYLPPKPYDARFEPGPERPLLRRMIPSYQWRQSKNASFYIDAYDGEIAYCDSQIGVFLNRLSELDLYDDAMVLFHADHGESMGEHGKWFEHGNDLYDDCARVPFLLKLPQGHAAAKETRGSSSIPVSVIDILSTIVDVAGLDPPPGIDGESVLSVLENGRRLSPYLLMDQTGFAAPRTYVAVRTVDRKIVAMVDQESGLKVLRKELYNLSEDPKEARDIYSSGDASQRDLDRALEDWIERMRTHELPFETTRWRPKDGDAFMQEREARHIEALRRLGYVE